MKRREFIRNAGFAAAGLAVAPKMLMAENSSSVGDVFSPGMDTPGELNDYDFSLRSLEARVSRPVTVAILGAGNRGSTYGKYSAKYPGSMKVVGVAEPIEFRRDRMRKAYGIPDEHVFNDYRDLLAVPKFADVVIVSTPDNLHFKPCMKALELGYDVLLEKPVAPTEKECRAILEMSHKTGRIVNTCHVLRYAPYFISMREMIRRGAIGEVVSIQHMEPIRFSHMAHSYVRGNWHNSRQTTPILLAKSCHDLDIIRWMVDRPCTHISADGSIYLFKESKAPQGATARCTDGCPNEKKCPFSAIEIYVRQKRHLGHFDLVNKKDDEEIMQNLRTTDYGRCVFHCDNDQPDHYVAEMEFEGGPTATFTMDAFTPYGGRRTRVMGTAGFIEGNGSTFSVTDFLTGKERVWNKKVAEIPEYKGSGHGGGDYAMLRDFLEAVDSHDPTKLSSSIDVSLESHLMGFAAERSRLKGSKEKVRK